MTSQRRMPIGVRGAPSGRRVDLEHADTSAVPHQLYVKIVTSGDPDTRSRAITLQVLEYVHKRLPMFAQMGLAVKVNRIRSRDLQNPRLVAVMKQRGILRLPALTTPNNVYLGYNEIADIYERNIREFAAQGRRGDKPVTGAVPEDDLARHFSEEMTFERAEEDAQETGIGEGEDMMDSYRRMMERRESSDAGRRKPGVSRLPVAPAEGRRAAPPRPTTSSRPDNVAGPPAPRRPPPLDPDDAEIQDTIDRLARDIDDSVLLRAHSASGGDSYDDDGGADIQDDLMERAYWSNQAES